MVRSFRTEFETREADDGQKTISGYFAVFDSQTELFPGGYEQIAPEAFDSSMNGDVRALINHDTRLVLGRTKAGTLRLRKDSNGLWGDITINEKDSDAMNLYERVKRGDVDQCSFGFIINAEDTEWRDDGTVLWTIRDVELLEVSPCTFPQYEDTGISARSKEVTRHKEKEAEQWKHNLKGKLSERR